MNKQEIKIKMLLMQIIMKYMHKLSDIEARNLINEIIQMLKSLKCLQ